MFKFLKWLLTICKELNQSEIYLPAKSRLHSVYKCHTNLYSLTYQPSIQEEPILPVFHSWNLFVFCLGNKSVNRNSDAVCLLFLNRIILYSVGSLIKRKNKYVLILAWGKEMNVLRHKIKIEIHSVHHDSTSKVRTNDLRNDLQNEALE